MSDSAVNLILKSKDQIDVIANAVRERQDHIRIQIDELNQEMDELDSLMNQIYPTQKAISELGSMSNLNGYNPEWSTSKKAAYVLGKNNRPMSTAEIADTIVNDLERGADRKHIVRNLSVLFATQKTKFKRSENSKGENVYML
jgi:hypothetical protein